MDNKKTSLIDFLIDFFATIYDLVIEAFASIYDLFYNAIFFLIEYLKWITDINSPETNDFNTHAEEAIQVRNQNSFDIR
ncbi:hypothetical protein [Flavobacterium sp.]|uniref:hypothetical protein n=1 Tax=Flavobacterium sp. TaxID=239 RepID=UPI002BD0D02A|nr:hypothetical protein [Flavobacterium sp.]HSD07027.1 hypothetical protein [Flavobacterium sp.]